MPQYDLYWVEKQEEHRTPTEISRYQAMGVVSAGVHFVTRGILTGCMTRAIPYNEWNNSRDFIDGIVANSTNPRAIFVNDTVIANANIRTTRELDPRDISTLDTLMEGIGFDSLRVRQGA